MSNVDAPSENPAVEIKINKKTVSLGPGGQATVAELLEKAGYPDSEINEYDLFVVGVGGEPLDREHEVSVTPGMQLRAIRRSNTYGV